MTKALPFTRDLDRVCIVSLPPTTRGLSRHNHVTSCPLCLLSWLCLSPALVRLRNLPSDGGDVVVLGEIRDGKGSEGGFIKLKP